MAKSVNDLMSEVVASMERIVASARDEGRDAALADVRMLLGGGSLPATKAKRGRPKKTGDEVNNGRRPGKKAKATKTGKPRKNPWAGLSDDERLARVNAIRKGRGLPTKKKL